MKELINKLAVSEDVIMLPYGSAFEVSDKDFCAIKNAFPLGYDIDRYSCRGSYELYRQSRHENGFTCQKLQGSVIGYVNIREKKFYIAQWVITYMKKHENNL